MYKVYVVLYNSYGCELRREKCVDMAEATDHVMDLCRTGNLEVGDRIAFEEID